MGRVTDAERREVARRMREFSKDKWPLTVGGNSATIRYAISDIVFNDKRYHSGVDLFNRLADLIEPSIPADPGEAGLACVDAFIRERTEKPVDRNALLALAEELDKDADNIISAARNAQFTGGGPRMGAAKHDAYEWRCIARLIRKALGK